MNLTSPLAQGFPSLSDVWFHRETGYDHAAYWQVETEASY